MTIPQLMHQIWIPPDDGMPDPPDDVQKNITQWKDKHAEFQHKLWSLDEVIQMSSQLKLGEFQNEDVVKSIKRCRFPAMQADICRLIILYLLGGFWIDLKIVPKTNFLAALTQNDLVLSEHFPKADIPDPGKFKLLINSFFGCRQHSEFVKSCLVLALQNVHSNKASVWEATGPRVFMTIRERLFPNLYDQTYPGVLFFRAGEIWEVLIGFGYNSYNLNNRHWSKRAELEPTYSDD